MSLVDIIIFAGRPAMPMVYAWLRRTVMCLPWGEALLKLDLWRRKLSAAQQGNAAAAFYPVPVVFFKVGKH